MTYLSTIEKLQILFNTLLDFKFILVLTILVLLFTFLYIIKKLSGKRFVLCMILSFVIVFAISIINNYEILSNTFDNFTTIFFGNIYFPSIYVYIGTLVMSLIVFVVSLLNVMLKRVYKVINSIMFIMNNILLIVVINIIAKNKIDIFSINSLYSDTTLVAILELSMGLFILWILSLVIVYATNCICQRLAHREVRNSEVEDKMVIFNPVLEINSDGISDENASVMDVNVDNNIKEDAILEQNIDNVKEEVINSIALEEDNQIDNITTGNEIGNVEEQVICSNTSDSVTFADILNGTVPVTYYDNGTVFEEHKLIDPQEVFEEKYNNVKNESVVFNDINIMLDDTLEKAMNEKEKVSEERFCTNTISLNDLINEDDSNTLKVEIPEVSAFEMVTSKEDNGIYTLDDYKKMANMLNSIKMHSNSTNINIDDAVALSLISNYSIDDCMKFKNILESNLN